MIKIHHFCKSFIKDLKDLNQTNTFESSRYEDDFQGVRGRWEDRCLLCDQWEGSPGGQAAPDAAQDQQRHVGQHRAQLEKGPSLVSVMYLWTLLTKENVVCHSSED